MRATTDLKQDHVILKRLRDIVMRCSDKLYSNENIPIEDIEIVYVVIDEFIDRFHHGKEEQAYFPESKDKDGSFQEDIRKFLIEHEFGRRVAKMLLHHMKAWKDGFADSKEPVARFLKTYAIFITDHTGKEDKFFDLIEEKNGISSKEDEKLLLYFGKCMNEVGGKARVEELIKLIEYLEERDWMK